MSSNMVESYDIVVGADVLAFTVVVLAAAVVVVDAFVYIIFEFVVVVVVFVVVVFGVVVFAAVADDHDEGVGSGDLLVVVDSARLLLM